MGGGVYGNNIIANKSSSDVSSNPNERSHSWEMRKPKKTINDGDGETTPLCWEKNKLNVTRLPEVAMRINDMKVNVMA